jgi:hypothetical protein
MPRAFTCVLLPLCVPAGDATSHRTFQNGCGIIKPEMAFHGGHF